MRDHDRDRSEKEAYQIRGIRSARKAKDIHRREKYQKAYHAAAVNFRIHEEIVHYTVKAQHYEKQPSIVYDIPRPQCEQHECQHLHDAVYLCPGASADIFEHKIAGCDHNR